MYRDTFSLLGPVLPTVSFLGRLPTAMCQLGSLLLVAETSGSLATAGLAGGALAAGQTVAGPVIGRLADGHGQRGVVLAASLAHPAAALLAAALLLAVCGSAFALHPTAKTTAPDADPITRPAANPDPGTRPAADRDPITRPGAAERGRLPRSVYALRGTMVLQGAMFGASQAGITALTEELGAPAQAGLVYAAMGVMSAAVGLSLAAVPARIGLTTRWRAATAGLVVLSVPLLFVGSLGALYAVVVVLGAAYAPHLITVFGLTERTVPAARLTERTVPAARLAESMAFLTSGIVGGQALALAVSGRLAESHGAPAAFAVAVGAAVACALLAWTVRVPEPRVAGKPALRRAAAERSG
ncbi:MFS transporter [Streptomyces sp. NBC_00090]|uniref:MFS transporter n=1 Tax=Streptomyces sp. NBC_00090 TaxID=2903619 RepID=UPI00324AD143